MLFPLTLDRSIFYIKGVWLVFIIIMFCRISKFNANSVDPDQTPRSAASDLGLRCLPMSFLWDARLKWVNTSYWYILSNYDRRQLSGFRMTLFNAS